MNSKSQMRRINFMNGRPLSNETKCCACGQDVELGGKEGEGSTRFYIAKERERAANIILAVVDPDSKDWFDIKMKALAKKILRNK